MGLFDLHSKNDMLRRIHDIPWSILPAWLMGKRLKILMYHSVSTNQFDPHATSPHVFLQHMQALQDKQVVSLEEALVLMQAGSSLSNTYVITFDDALLDFYMTAMPILQGFDYPVTMFVPTGLVGGKAIWDSYDKSKALMTWKQLGECQQWNVTFASHTLNHARLTECSDAVLMDELRTSLQMLADNLGQMIPALAYPGGFHDERVRRVAQDVGYICALGASSRWGNGPESDLFQLRRERFKQ